MVLICYRDCMAWVVIVSRVLCKAFSNHMTGTQTSGMTVTTAITGVTYSRHAHEVR